MKHALRSLSRNPAFAAMAILLMAFGIGSATILFSVFDALMLRPLPAPHPEQLVRLITTKPNIGARSGFSRKFYEAVAADAKSFSTAGATFDDNMPLEEGSRIERARVAVAFESYFRTFGVKPSQGRGFGNNDSSAALISYAYWKRHFQSDSRVVGRKIEIRNAPFEIWGILPEGFHGAQVETAFDVYVALSSIPRLYTTLKDNDEFPYFEITARLAPGVTLKAAQQETEAIYRRSLAEAPQQGIDRFSIEPIERGVSRLRDQSGSAVSIAMGAVAILLVMVCANLSGLLLARFAARDAEFSLRRALGAGSASLFLLAFGEAFAITGTAALLSAALTLALLPLISASLPPVRLLDTTMVPMALSLRADWRVWLFSLAVTLLASLGMSAMPAWRARSQSLEASLRGAKASRQIYGRTALVAFQVALCTLFAVGAMLTVSTLKNLRALDPGFAKDQIACFSIDPLLRTDRSSDVSRALAKWYAEIEQLPGVLGVATSGRRLLRGSGLKMTIAPVGQKVAPSDFMNTSMHSVSASYFETMGIRLLAGRFLAREEYKPRSDQDKSLFPIVLNSAFARKFFPGQDPLGRRVGSAFRAAAKAEDVIVGVVSDAKYRSLREPVPPTIYTPFLDSFIAGQESFTLLVRTSERANGLLEPVRRIIQSSYPEMPVLEPATLAEDVEASLWTEKLLANLAILFAILAIAIAAAGLYALLAYLVILRKREIGIRMAVGAQRNHILTLILSESARPVAAGILAGLAMALASAPFLDSLLFGIEGRDVFSLVLASMLVLAAAVVALAIPAFNAVRISPASVLRDAG